MKDQLKKLHQRARLDRDAIATEAYGSALAAIQEGEVRANSDFDEAKILATLEKEAGKFRESAEAFAKAGRQEKVQELEKCAELLQALLPAKLDASAYPDLISSAVADTGASSMKDMGKVMAKLKEEHGASLDMKIVSQEVKKALANL